ncbi:LytR/AlgR family response regulator transcription factor [Chitinophaga qingshengii]|uniref:Response regulator transcription factor n=1 Tax=Chitinophaga qingshengii TaxID=1569794 RepID=A0ABR7TFT9_9BACT|nr:response regulator transcription factor [Chitinophaga qingshengii]MBC9929255.1 response regulator transcription factor [Chitinophaga qingshengii]
MLIDCIIIEDEPLALKKTAGFIQKVPYLNLVGEFYSSMEAFLYLKEHPVTLAFVDIEMEGLNGLELIASLKNIPYTVITTAYEQYALKGYELNVADYLLKPFDFSRFLKTVERIHEQAQARQPESRDFFFIQAGYRNIRIFYNDVLYIEGMRDYRCVYTEKEKILTLQTFNELESIVAREKLCRIHKSFMIAVDKVAFIERGHVMIRERLLPVSETYRSAFYALLGFKDGKSTS